MTRMHWIGWALLFALPPAAAEVPGEQVLSAIATISTGEQPYSDKARQLQTILSEADRHGHLTDALLTELVRESPRLGLVLSSLDSAVPKRATGFYAHALMLSPPLPEATQTAVATHLAQLTSTCTDESLFRSITKRGSLPMRILIARSFARSRPGDVERLALDWAEQTLADGIQGEAELMQLRDLNDVLAGTGTKSALAAVLKHLRRLGPTCEAYVLVPGLRALGDARYPPALSYCLEVGAHDKADCPCRVAALQAASAIGTRDRTNEARRIAERLLDRKDFYPMYRPAVQKLIAQWKRTDP